MTFLSSFRVRCNVALLAFVTSVSAVGCGFGGLNDNIEGVGDQPGGVSVALGDIAVSPSGKFIVFQQEESLAVGWVESGDVELLPVERPSRVAFSKTRAVIYATTDDGTLHAVDVESGKTEWTAELELAADASDWMVVASKDDARVAIAGGTQVRVFSAEDGKLVAEHGLETAAVDLEILPDDERLLVVEDEVWTDGVPNAAIDVVILADGAVKRIDVPNCADNIIVPPDGNVALLAPTTCVDPEVGSGHDPISHIDLEAGKEAFVRNLPGFGPVAMSPDGSTAVGFLDMNAVDASLFDDPELIPSTDTRFHLMIIDTSTMTYDFAAYGESLPRYAPTPDGEILLVDEQGEKGATLFDVATKSFRDVKGVDAFDAVSFASNSQDAYVLSDLEVHAEGEADFDEAEAEGEIYFDYALFHLDTASAEAVKLPTTFRPRNLNISPDDERLFLRRSRSEICVYSLADQSCERNIVVGKL